MYLTYKDAQIMDDLGISGLGLEKKEKTYIAWLDLLGVSYDQPYIDSLYRWLLSNNIN